LVLSSHSLEHFRYEDLIDFLETLAVNMAEDGIFLAEVPHADMRIGYEHREQDSPHLLFFSKKSLHMLFTQNGFEVLFIETCGERYQSRTETTGTDLRSWKRLKALKKLVKIYFADFIKTIFMKIGVKGRIDLNDNNFSYGGSRQCLRVVARPLPAENHSDNVP
jgi:hypothetical protein